MATITQAPAPTESTNPKPKGYRPHGVQHNKLISAAVSSRASVIKQVERGKAELQAAIDEMLVHATAVLRSASKTGPKLSEHLHDKAKADEMSLDQIDTASRVWDRMLRTSREVLNLDAKETVNVVVMGSGKITSASSAASSAASNAVIDVPCVPVPAPAPVEDPSI